MTRWRKCWTISSRCPRRAVPTSGAIGKQATYSKPCRYPFLVSEVFNCELGKVNDLFFTSRADVEEKEPPKKKALCSPLTNSE